MSELVVCAAPGEGIDDEYDPDFRRYCREECSGRHVSPRCDPCTACSCGGYSCRPATFEEIESARHNGKLQT